MAPPPCRTRLRTDGTNLANSRDDVAVRHPVPSDRSPAMRRAAILSSLILACSVLSAPVSAVAETVVRYGISLADIPLTTGQPDRGAGAYQFTGHTIYDPLVAWEMDIAERPGKLIPGLATERKVNPA